MHGERKIFSANWRRRRHPGVYTICFLIQKTDKKEDRDDFRKL
jgi:hypothetical protein